MEAWVLLLAFVFLSPFCSFVAFFDFDMPLTVARTIGVWDLDEE